MVLKEAGRRGGVADREDEGGEEDDGEKGRWRSNERGPRAFERGYRIAGWEKGDSRCSQSADLFRGREKGERRGGGEARRRWVSRRHQLRVGGDEAVSVSNRDRGGKQASKQAAPAPTLGSRAAWSRSSTFLLKGPESTICACAFRNIRRFRSAEGEHHARRQRHAHEH